MLKRSYKIALFIVGILAAALVGAYLYLPHYVETRLIPQLAQTAGFTVQTVKVGAIGFTATELGPIQFGAGEQKVLSVDRLRLSYSPLTLLHRKIDRIHIEGLTFSLRMADGALYIGERRISPDESRGSGRSLPVLPLLPFRALSMENAVAEIAWESGTARMPFAIDLTAQDSTEGAQIEGRCTVGDASAADAVRRIEAQKIALELPFAWPAPPEISPGRLTVGQIVWQDQPLGDLSGTIQQNGMGLVFELAHRSQLLSDLIVLLRGTAAAEQAQVDFQVPDYRPTAPIDLGRFLGEAAGMLLTGLLAAEGHVNWKNDSLSASADLRIAEGGLSDAGRDLRISGIEAALRMEDLLGPRSAAGQRLTIQSVQWGNIVTDGLRVEYRVAPPDRLLIDRAILEWCGGRVESGPMALSSSVTTVDVTLTAQDLNLARMLHQLDLAEGSGEGTLRGRIPLRWSKGNISFGKGSLASPPGQTGVIRLKKLQGTQDLFAALPADAPQRTQLDIALEALKDYTYRSIALQVESQADTLLLQLQLDGKPNRLMPFAYDEALGRLKRVEGEGLAEFKGVGIDLNFRSPLNDILNYRDLLKPQ